MWMCKGGIDAVTAFCKVQSPYPSIISLGVDMMLIEKFTDGEFLLGLLTTEELGLPSSLK